MSLSTITDVNEFRKKFTKPFNEVVNDIYRYGINGENFFFHECGGVSEIVQILLDAGVHANHRNDDGANPLAIGWGRNDPSIAKILIDNGVNAANVDNLGKNALFYVDNIEVLKMLVAAGANPHQTDYKGHNVIYYKKIQSFPDSEIIQYFRELGVIDVTEKTC
jgi:ankyrin repeat protein